MFNLITGLSKEEIPTKENPELMFEDPFPGKDYLLYGKDYLEKTRLIQNGSLKIGKDLLHRMPAYIWKGMVIKIITPPSI